MTFPVTLEINVELLAGEEGQTKGCNNEQLTRVCDEKTPMFSFIPETWFDWAPNLCTPTGL